MKRDSDKAEGLVPFAFCLLPFLVLCTVNSAGYRYGASDQAFYVPAVLERLDPGLFPRDTPLIASQAHLTLVDETIAGLVRVTGASLPFLFAALYALSLALLGAAGWLIAARFYRSAWTGAAVAAALTLRHAIAQSGTNTLEGYFHPRQAAFALGALAIAAMLQRRRLLVAALVLAAACVHPTTAIWFALWLGVAHAVDDARLRVPLLAAAAAVAAGGAWAVSAGPLAGRLAIMDPEWLATLTSKDYLFPLAWPWTTWALNMIYAPIVVLAYRRRAAAGLAVPFERGLVAGVLALLAIFVLSLPLNAARVALAVQLQVPRVFWMLDFLATIYAVWALAEGTAASVRVRRAQVTAALVLLASCARGGYVLAVRFPERALAQYDIPDGDWARTMRWAQSTDRGSGWLADPLHAVKYGTSLRVAGHRDVFVESVKDTAIGMYDRAVAMRTRDRRAALGDFATLDAGRASALAAAYDLDYLVTEGTLALPLVYSSGALRVYRLR
jgi:hypothetical protein